jgi:hypothetical protein
MSISVGDKAPPHLFRYRSSSTLEPAAIVGALVPPNFAVFVRILRLLPVKTDILYFAPIGDLLLLLFGSIALLGFGATVVLAVAAVCDLLLP